MAIIVTSARRRIVMAVLLSLATAGAVIRIYAPDPSTLRDLGTLLLVLWLPAVGNLVAWTIGRIPRRHKKVLDFAPGSAFQPQLRVRLHATPELKARMASFSSTDTRCLLLLDGEGFRARFGQPLARAVAAAGEQPQDLQLLRPQVALPRLPPGTEFHVLAGTIAVATGRVLDHLAA